MQYYDPWVFGMLFEAEHREELQRIANQDRARQASAWQPTASSELGTWRTRSRLRQLLTAVMSFTRLRSRGQAAKVS